VGKTSILTRYFDKNFDIDSKSTIGVDMFQNNDTEIAKETEIRYCYWDNAGQERFKSIIISYYQNVDGVVIVYDITDKKTFDSIDYWYNIVKENDPVVFIVGNKCESNNRKISRDLEKDIVAKYKCFFMEVSAKSGDERII
jgi:small GTP-binding protein